MHEDYIAFVSGLNRKILAVTDAACDVLNKAYKLLAKDAPNEPALKELRKNSRAFAFRHFAEPGAAAG